MKDDNYHRISRARPKGFKSYEDYEPKQRGIVSTATNLFKRKGTRLLHDGDLTFEECEDCGYTLRVRKEKGRSVLWCPCGYEINANEIGD